MNTDKKYFLSWQNQVLGPHSVEEIKSLLNDRKIHSLFKVQSDGKEVLIREFLAGLNDERNRAANAPPKPPKPTAVDEKRPGHYDQHSETAGSPPPPPPPHVVLRGRQGFIGPPPPPPPPHTENEAKFGYAVASLVLSLLFILPFINLIGWVMSLIFGHMFLYTSNGDRTQRGYLHAWCGVCLTYIFGSFYLIVCFAFAFAGSDNPFIQVEDWLPGVHGMMLGGAISAAVVSGLLIAGTKLLTGTTPKTGVAFVAGTLGAMVGIILQFLLGLMAPDAMATSNASLLAALSVGVVVFLIQALVWSQMIRVRDEEKLGFGRAAIVSLFCSICQLFLAFVLIFVLIFFAKTFA